MIVFGWPFSSKHHTGISTSNTSHREGNLKMAKVVPVQNTSGTFGYTDVSTDLSQNSRKSDHEASHGQKRDIGFGVPAVSSD